MSKINQIKEQVTIALTLKNDTRDCDLLLYCQILKMNDAENTPAWWLFQKIKAGKLPSFDSVTRIRRMVQLCEPTLRGELWVERHTKKQQKAKNDLGYAN
jgi:hypothetical protein